MTLTKQKQIALLRLAVIVAVVLFGLWFFLIRSAQDRLFQKSSERKALTDQLAAKKQVIQRAEQTKSDLDLSSNQLRQIETQMVSGDIYLWIQKTLRDFEIPDQIEFIKYDPPQIVDGESPWKLPYKVASFAVNGSATYHDLGTFLANFENSYPHIRIRRIEMEPASVNPLDKSEKLSFILEMHVLVRPGPASKPRS